MKNTNTTTAANITETKERLSMATDTRGRSSINVDGFCVARIQPNRKRQGLTVYVTKRLGAEPANIQSLIKACCGIDCEAIVNPTYTHSDGKDRFGVKFTVTSATPEDRTKIATTLAGAYAIVVDPDETEAK